ncbi:MAG: lysophospholipid acyltransferase family protein [Candidatus Latescibacterota bacterium]|jgi:KDO2-lipid IV(A) lauroyltransferase
MADRIKTSYYIELAAVKLVEGLVRLFPLSVSRRFGALLGWKAYRVFRIRRRTALDNIVRALPDTGQETADAIACESYMNLGRSMVEFVSLDRLDAEKLREMVQFESLEPVDEALASGRGVVLFTGHYGNWELGAAALGARGYRVNLVVGRQSNPLVNAEANRLRAGMAAGIVDRGSGAGLRGAMRALDNNEIVAFVADQDARHHGAFVDFLGRPASTHKGPAQFAVRRNAPVVAGFIRRLQDGTHSVALRAPMWPDRSLDEDDAVGELMQRYTDALSDAIRAHPAQYFWAHRRWKTAPP